ncbi:hypothetical protein FBY10_11160 [Pseudomonas sp. SJZ103]|uniref:hypothetical protein n=1 Tax=unclassified Pseudomonas TaxID=196821 RepID=UPI0011A49D33|nr:MULTISPECIES: hypothetical protein [unclassified Pseudomonas]MBB6287286.1 hypothetical protein [Pseudomonas sp. SJZ073]MBB6310787.1 hypothetical protein [Pseudomonas sp. JAI120]TWC64906.1 hypothetical protein FBY10_11160 [Pseudomonas sp. SJZ103]TWC81920.1 hypothetical protein FBY08_112155 [Pseudomonas sp. SJZ094]
MTTKAKPTASTGSLTAAFTGSHTHSFVSDLDRQHIFKSGEHWRFSGVELQSGDPHQNYYGLNVVLPADLEENGKKHIYSFPDEVTGFVFAPYGAGISVYRIVSGEITVSVLNEEMNATFHLSAEFNEAHVDLTDGELHLKGISYPRLYTDTFNGTFRNSPFPSHEDFVAKTVGIISHESPFFPDSWEVFGSRDIDSFPPSNQIVSIQITKNLTEHDYVISPKSTEVFVNCSARPAYGLYAAVGGNLHFDSLPATGRAKGTLKCSFIVREGVEFQFDGGFDVGTPFYIA